MHSESDLGTYTATFFKFAVEAIKAVDPRLRVGGPALASPLGLKAFLAQAKELALPVDFVSTHIYANARECPAGVNGYHPGVDGFYWNPDCYFGLVDWARAQVLDIDHES